MPPEQPSCPLRLTLDSDALVHNWRTLDRLSGAAKAGAAVKADGYGLGAKRVVQTLAGAGCADFFVAHMDEAAPLLSLVPAKRIAVLHGPLTPQDAAFAKAVAIRPVINSVRQAQLWQDAGGGRCDLMIDTGINRLGVPLADLGDPVLQGLQIDVLHSHLASAEEDSPLNDLQRRRWDEARSHVPHSRASLANSAGLMLGADYHGDLTRPGIALYGGVPCAALTEHIRQVARPEAVIMQVRKIAAGDSIGYNATFTAPTAMRVGVISLGYADGYLRCWSGKGTMLSGEARLPVLGRVSMDMTVIDLSAAPQLREGDWVSADYDLPDAAAVTGLSQYELLTSLGRRFPR
ncbi:MAG: alanine racemase [Novosphingobium sp.]|jgi:alanine racemase|nr:alanine racemase [Novosphingobium sp.]